jgi:hypothetical protein
LNFLQSHLEHCIVHDKLDSSSQLLNEQGWRNTAANWRLYNPVNLCRKTQIIQWIWKCAKYAQDMSSRLIMHARKLKYNILLIFRRRYTTLKKWFFQRVKSMLYYGILKVLFSTEGIE